MTVFGKLLVFMNLVFSVITGALIVFVFTTRANWQTAYEDAKKKAEAAEVAYKNEKAAHENDNKQKDAAAEAVRGSVEVVKRERDALQMQNEQLAKAAETQRNTNTTSNAQQNQVAAELAQIKVERDAVVKEKDDLRVRLVNIQKELDTQRGIAVDESLKAANLVQRNANLLREVEALSGRLRELEAQAALSGGGTGATSTGAGSVVDGYQKSAPPNVRGKVTEVAKDGTLAQIDIGSDSGLSVGNVLTIYLGTEYKGDLTLTAVNPKVAVGKFTPYKRTSKVSKDDAVITSFGTRPQ